MGDIQNIGTVVKKPKQHVMLDLETLGTGPDSVVVSIGACWFDPRYPTSAEVGANFYQVMDRASQAEMGRYIDPGTVDWWMKQSDAARLVFADESWEDGDIVHQLEKFSVWMGQIDLPENILVWGNGSDFDNAMLCDLYNDFHIIRGWGDYNNRCYRTVKSMAKNIKAERFGTYHNALDDAITQARHLSIIANTLNLELA